jgi:UDP-2,3-diacylglucosamine pyrophosphatase LpxH
LILNDLHLGVKRVTGTTPASAQALRDYLLSSFRNLLPADKDVLILGDLFDDFTVETMDFWNTLSVLLQWLSLHKNNLFLVRGNHDWHPRGDKLSSFDALANLLRHMYQSQVQVVRGGATCIGHGIWVVPHMPNQDLFDLELDEVAKGEGAYLLTHCDMMPPAVYGQRDHSLAIGEARAKQLAERFVVLNAHEHQAISYNLGRGIHCLGNQIPSSIADCLTHGKRQADGRKYTMTITPDLGRAREVTWDATASFHRVDWRDIDTLPDETQFVRIEGQASASEAVLAVDAIAKLRNSHSAFVISNAVAVEGQEGVEEAAAAVSQNLKAFDLMAALLAELEPTERQIIEEVLQ